MKIKDILQWFKREPKHIYWEVSYLKELHTILYISQKHSNKLLSFNRLIKIKKFGFFTEYKMYIDIAKDFDQAKYIASKIIENYTKGGNKLNEYLR